MLLADALGADASPGPLFRDATFEELANTVVAAVSRREERVFSVPAATTVLSNDSLRHSGATSVPEALRAVPGLNVAQISPDTWAVGARGFQWQFANKLLVMIDGRSIYSPTLGGVPWEDNPVFLEDVSRVEVVRGPGASFWGANAVNGVIDIVSRDARETLGTLAVARFGDGDASVGGRVGTAVGDHAAMRIYAQHEEAESWRLPAGGTADNDYRRDFGGWRLDWSPQAADHFTFQAGGHERRSDYHRTFAILLAPPSYVVESRAPIHARGLNASAQWRHEQADGAAVTVSAYWDRIARNRPQFFEHVTTTDLEAVYVGRPETAVRFSGGLGYRGVDSRLDGKLYQFVPSRSRPELFNGFASIEFSLDPEKLKLTLGSKLEHHQATGWNVQPTARLAWQPRPGVVVWTSASQAVRTPTLSELTSDVDAAVFPAGAVDPLLPAVVRLVGNPGLKAERMTAFELGARWSPAPEWQVDMATFAYDYRHYVMATTTVPSLQVLPVPAIVLPERFQNGLTGEAYGGELSLGYEPHPRWRLAANVSYTQIQLHTRLPDPLGYEQDEGTTPHLTVAVSSDWHIGQRWTVHLAARQVGRVPYYTIPAYVALDAGVSYRLSEQTELSLVGRDLGDGHHPEYDSAFNRQLTEVGRTVSLRCRWSY